MSRTLDAVREQVAEAVDDGASLDALWLYAWNLREQAQRPEDAR